MTSKRTLDAIWAPLLLVAATLTLARGFRPPVAYAVGHWLLSYDRGFIKRGLVGTLVRPLLAFKAADEVSFVIETLSLLVLLAVVAGLVASSRSHLSWPDVPERQAWALRLTPFVALTSGWCVFAGHTNGFFDHFVEALTLVAVALVGTRGRWFIPLLCLAGVLTHEVFLVYGFPVVCLALVAEARQRSGRRGWWDAGLFILTVVVAAATVVRSTANLSDQAVAAVEQSVARYGVVSDAAASNAVYHLTHGLRDNLAAQSTGWWHRALRSDLAVVAAPPVLLFGTWSAILLSRARAWWLGAMWVVVVGAPLVLHEVAWDTPRFTLMVVFHAFVAWLVVARWVPMPSLARAPSACLVLAGCGVLFHNVLQRVPLMDDEIDGDATLAPRLAPSRHSFSGCQALFRNADFESGNLRNWTVEGEAFEGALKLNESKQGSHPMKGAMGRWWLGSYEDGDEAGGDTLTGRLESVSFRIDGPTILLAVGGGYVPDELRVSLVVEGREVAWATGHNGNRLVPIAWDLSDEVGKRGKIVIIDAATGGWGHINVDGLCTFRP